MKRMMVALQDRVVVPCDYVGARLVKLAGIPPDKLRTIPYGVEIPSEQRATVDVRVEMGLAENTRLVGMVARLDPKNKSYDVFLNAAAQVHAARPSTHFLLVGGGTPAYRAELENLAVQLGLSACVHFLGFRQDVAGLVAALDVVALASKNEACVPIAILEAMARGVPVILTDLGGAREQMRHADTGLLVFPGDVGALAGATIQMLDDREAASAMGRRARQMAIERFSIPAMIAGLDALYRELRAERSDRHHVSAGALRLL